MSFLSEDLISDALSGNQLVKPQYWEAHIPCAPGSSGEGYYVWVVKDDVTGEVLGSGTSGAGCTNEVPPV